MTRQVLDKQRVSDEIVETLRNHILTGQYSPGDKLPPERELAKRLGVNRASLREALKKLEHLGLLKSRQGDGTRVQNFLQTGGIELLEHLLALAGNGRPDIVIDVLEFRQTVGREIARMAAVRATDEDLAKLTEVAARASEVEDRTELFQIDFQFYIAMTGATHNLVLGLLVNTVRDAVLAHAALLAPMVTVPDEVRAHHKGLLAALGDKDSSRAAEIANAYLALAVRRIRDLTAT